MAVAAHDDEVGANVNGERNNRISHARIGAHDLVARGFDAVQAKMALDVIERMDIVVTLAPVDQVNSAGGAKKRHRARKAQGKDSSVNE
ncbi:MAG: hypothetical protein JF606_24545 [Burkholderiales bacterium]|nr:hypothetical protein [Burkholderiales bacterium]